jgi:hypothetical protein
MSIKLLTGSTATIAHTYPEKTVRFNAAPSTETYVVKEEGFWTPVFDTENMDLSATITFDPAKNTYLKLDRLVRLEWFMNISAISSQGRASID